MRVSFRLIRFFSQSEKEGGGNWKRKTREWEREEWQKKEVPPLPSYWTIKLSPIHIQRI